MLHSWELPAPGSHSWETVAPEPAAPATLDDDPEVLALLSLQAEQEVGGPSGCTIGSDDELEDPPAPPITEGEASRELAEKLISTHLARALRAKDLCTISWWASKAGVKGAVADLAFNP
eukprot:15479012-Alexandrium_andersonii.AAC.1